MRALGVLLAIAGLAASGPAWTQTAESAGDAITAESKAVTNSIGMEFRSIQPGKFMMGGGGSDDQPVHEVTITKPFLIGVHAVTERQYERVMGGNQAELKGVRRPRERVSWNAAKDFCRKLSEMENVEYRLPTEAEWEYACRAGTSTEFYWGDKFDPQYAWIEWNSGGTAQNVGARRPNPWGLFDMSGNVWEWCEDWYDGGDAGSGAQVDPKGPSDGKYRVLRGGSWNGPPEYCRSASRDYLNPDSRTGSLGFRVVRTP